MRLSTSGNQIGADVRLDEQPSAGHFAKLPRNETRGKQPWHGWTLSVSVVGSCVVQGRFLDVLSQARHSELGVLGTLDYPIDFRVRFSLACLTVVVQPANSPLSLVSENRPVTGKALGRISVGMGQPHGAALQSYPKPKPVLYSELRGGPLRGRPLLESVCLPRPCTSRYGIAGAGDASVRGGVVGYTVNNYAPPTHRHAGPWPPHPLERSLGARGGVIVSANRNLCIVYEGFVTAFRPFSVSL